MPGVQSANDRAETGKARTCMQVIICHMCFSCSSIEPSALLPGWLLGLGSSGCPIGKQVEPTATLTEAGPSLSRYTNRVLGALYSGFFHSMDAALELGLALLQQLPLVRWCNERLFWKKSFLALQKCWLWKPSCTVSRVSLIEMNGVAVHTGGLPYTGFPSRPFEVISFNQAVYVKPTFCQDGLQKERVLSILEKQEIPSTEKSF